jgi:HK97 family phage major capsid protein
VNLTTLPRTGADHPLVKLSRHGRHPIGHRKDGRPIFPVAGGAGDAMLERLVSEREACLARVEAVSAAASESDRDLSDQDAEVITRAKERVAKLDEQIDLLSFDTAISDRAADAMRRNNIAVPRDPQTQYRSAGAALWDMLHLDAGGSEGKEARQRFDREMNRAAQHMGVDAANTVPVAGGLGALVVRPVVGPVIDPTPAGRPFLNLLGVQPLDSPMGFSRPRISDPNIDQAPDVQGVGTANVGKEKAELVSRAFDIKLEPVETQTIGEYLNVSEKLRALPIGAWNIILARFAKRRSRKTERYALAEVRESTTTVDLAADADADAIYDAIWEAALQVFLKTGELPQWITAGPTGWARLGALRDAAGRPLFPTMAAGVSVNSMGRLDPQQFAATGPAGLPMAVSYGITDGAFVLGNDASLEVYEYAYPMLEAVEPSVMGRQVAVASELASYRPATEGLSGNTPTGNGAVIVRPAVV